MVGPPDPSYLDSSVKVRVSVGWGLRLSPGLTTRLSVDMERAEAAPEARECRLRVGDGARDSELVPGKTVEAEWKPPSSYLKGRNGGSSAGRGAEIARQRCGGCRSERLHSYLRPLEGAWKSSGPGWKSRVRGANRSSSPCAQKDLRLLPDAGLTGRAIHMISREAVHGRKVLLRRPRGGIQTRYRFSRPPRPCERFCWPEPQPPCYARDGAPP